MIWVEKFAYIFFFEKSEKFDVFKKFKTLVEKQTDVPVKMLHTNRGESCYLDRLNNH